MTAFPRILVDAVVFVVMALTALGGLVFGWVKWRKERRRAELPAWRRGIATIGLVAVVAQALVFIALWTCPQIDQDYKLFGQWARCVLPSFGVAMPCTLAGKGASRWWLLSSSFLLFTVSFFTALSV